jgi:predicted restriction endonuclease
LYIGVDEKTIREIREISRIKRNQKLVDEIKLQYDFTCQICGEQLKIRSDVYYSEVHHIKPLGSKHNGPDISDNMLSVCPNHHALLDLGAIEIDLQKLLKKHNIRKDFIEYHNSSIFMKVI